MRIAFQLAEKMEKKLERSKILQRKMSEKQKINILRFSKDLRTKDSESLYKIKQDWRIEAAYFEEMLIDYDVHSNYGNWMYLARVGNDNRDQTFDPDKQAELYDPNNEFRKLWLHH